MRNRESQQLPESLSQQLVRLVHQEAHEDLDRDSIFVRTPEALDGSQVFVTYNDKTKSCGVKKIFPDHSYSQPHVFERKWLAMQDPEKVFDEDDAREIADILGNLAQDEQASNG